MTHHNGRHRQWTARKKSERRPECSTKFLVSTPQIDAAFTPVLSSGYEVARIPVEDGVHRVETVSGEDGLGLIVLGFDEFDSYAYIGGMGTGVINPIIIIK